MYSSNSTKLPQRRFRCSDGFPSLWPSYPIELLVGLPNDDAAVIIVKSADVNGYILMRV